MFLFLRHSALMADGWLLWQWTVPSVSGTSPLEGKTENFNEWLGQLIRDISWSSDPSFSSILSLVDCFLVATAPVSVSLSPTGDFLATAHVDSLGLYLWYVLITMQPLLQQPIRGFFSYSQLVIWKSIISQSQCSCPPLGLIRACVGLWGSAPSQLTTNQLWRLYQASRWRRQNRRWILRRRRMSISQLNNWGRSL